MAAAATTKQNVYNKYNSSLPKFQCAKHSEKKMSVFADFQRMWLKRFPDNSLSSEWEDDVRVSLQRHKQKVVDLSKELEQEMLYVEYLERLLSDVEEFRKSGGDPSIPIQRTTQDNDDNDNDDLAAQSIDKYAEKCDEITTNDEHTSKSINGVCVTHIKYSL